MAAPKETLWELVPHTRAKHVILQRYLEAWLPILSQGGFPQVLYVDGFAGPGRYSGGEDGSPIIALKAALAHKDRLKSTLLFYFVERDEDRAACLSQLLAEMTLPSRWRTKVEPGKTFEEAFPTLQGFYSGKGKPLPPTFAFLDPFGWDVPMKIVREILAAPSCEVFINFMYEEVNRFLSLQEHEEKFDRFFGCGDWRNCVKLATPAERNRFLHDLYRNQLHAAGAKYVRSFQMKNARNAVDYYLFYATNSFIGLQKMKEAMWKLDKTGEFRFSDATNANQSVLFDEPHFEALQHMILQRFRGKEITLRELEEFVVAETPFRETHYKREILKPLESASSPGITIVNAPLGRRRGTFPDPDMRIRFR